MEAQEKLRFEFFKTYVFTKPIQKNIFFYIVTILYCKSSKDVELIKKDNEKNFMKAESFPSYVL